MINRIPSIILTLFSGILLTASWFWGLTALVFAGLVPLLIVESRISNSAVKRKNLKLLLHGWLAFLVWNIGVTWWVVYASFGGAILAFVFNALFMAMVLVIWSSVKSLWQSNRAQWLLVPFWLAWEHGHTLWDISWTWLTLGNVFAFKPGWIQWYEYTGVSGGSLWILVANLVIYECFFRNPGTRINVKRLAWPAAIIVLPLLISLVAGRTANVTSHRTGETAKVVIVQPNIDPYNEKFTFDYESQFAKALGLIRGKITEETDYLILPETFITGISWYGIDENELNNAQELMWFRDSLMRRFPNLRIVAGGNTYRFYQDESEVTVTARRERRSGQYFDVFNTAIYFDSHSSAVYHKSKLVPGVEKMPFPALLKPLESLAIDMGGTVGSLGMQENRAVFTDRDNFTVAPVICYESVYADYVTDYIRQGAHFIFIITNDGWWEDTPGYIQHLYYGTLRAIENRRQIARSANTGISCVINERGEILQPTGWWQEAVITADLYQNDGLTFFARFGDLISRTAVILALAALALAVFTRLRNRGNRQPKKT